MASSLRGLDGLGGFGDLGGLGGLYGEDEVEESSGDENEGDYKDRTRSLILIAACISLKEANTRKRQGPKVPYACTYYSPVVL